jgi:ABC-2 type transport system permease protein
MDFIRYFYSIFRRELRVYLSTPIAYIVGGVFHALLGYFFYSSFVNYSRRAVEISASVRDMEDVFTPTVVILQGIWLSMGTIFLLLTPLITMRLVAEEKRARTMEMLLTSPLSIGAILLGKFAGAFVVYSFIILLTLYMPVVLEVFSSVNWAHVAVAYAGLLLIGAAMISVGLFASTVTDKQVISAVLAIGMLVIFWFVGGGLGISSQKVSLFISKFSMFIPFNNLRHGLLDLRDIILLFSYVAVMFFLSHRVLESERW